jgi:hypothetical protein
MGWADGLLQVDPPDTLGQCLNSGNYMAGWSGAGQPH